MSPQLVADDPPQLTKHPDPLTRVLKALRLGEDSHKSNRCTALLAAHGHCFPPPICGWGGLEAGWKKQSSVSVSGNVMTFVVGCHISRFVDWKAVPMTFLQWICQVMEPSENGLTLNLLSDLTVAGVPERNH